jgi:hypothetical protein
MILSIFESYRNIIIWLNDEEQGFEYIKNNLSHMFHLFDSDFMKMKRLE